MVREIRGPKGSYIRFGFDRDPHKTCVVICPDYRKGGQDDAEIEMDDMVHTAEEIVRLRKAGEI